ncbi:MAG: tetratricopeptide repeat protein [Cyanobacteria bacterium P01_G01_bin.19]
MTRNFHILQLAAKYHQANDFTQAKQFYSKILEVEPNQPDALYGLGVLERQRGKDSEAEKMFRALLDIQPKYFKAWFSLGNLYQAQGQWLKAEQAYQQALILRPNEAPIYNNLGYTQKLQGKLDEAICCYQQALSIQPNCKEAEVNLIEALNAQESSVENALNEIGAKSLARVIRKIRLVNHFEDPLKRHFYNCFIQGNLVILVIFSIFLWRIAQQNKIEQYLFSSRDCYYLHKIFERMVGKCELPIDCQYFFTSRLARVKGSQDYLSYLLDLANKEKNSAIVDLVGTGSSLSYLLNNKINLDFSLPIVFFHQTKLSRVKNIYHLDDELNLNNTTHSLISPESRNVNLDVLEILNYINQPMIKDVLKQDDNEYVPSFCSNSMPDEILTLIDCSEQIIDDFSNHLNPEMIAEIIDIVDWEDLKSLSAAIYHQLYQHHDLFSYFMTFHVEENKMVERQLSILVK